MLITNTTEYYAWSTQWNGLKRPDDDLGSDTGAFAVVNMLGPRDETQQDRIDHWRHFSFVELKVQFTTGASRQPIVLPRTYLTFYDFDQGLAPLRQDRNCVHRLGDHTRLE